MKILAIGIIVLMSVPTLFAQVNWNVGERIKKKVEQRVDQGIDQAIDKGINEAEEGVKEGAKKDGKTSGSQGQTNSGTGTQTLETNEQAQEDYNNPGAVKKENPPLQAYSKFDFVPGAKIIAFEDFSQDAVGDFPARWNTNSSAEVVTLSTLKGNWLKIDNANNASYIPDDFNNLPENFTLEFDLVYNNWNNEYAYSRRIFASFFQAENKTSDKMDEFGSGDGFCFQFDGGMGDGSIEIFNLANGWAGDIKNERPFAAINPNNNGKVFHIAIWRQKTRVRIYVDDQKVFDLPRILDPAINLNAFRIYTRLSDAEKPVFVSNFRLAVGAPDTRNKLITEGKFSTIGILFDVNSDKIKAESYGTLKDIANVLLENPDVKVRIIGHTDSDGDAAKNLELSQKRAAAVKEALVSVFGIDASRLLTDGKGATEPVSPNTTIQGKAANRRVEFVKL